MRMPARPGEDAEKLRAPDGRAAAGGTAGQVPGWG